MKSPWLAVFVITAIGFFPLTQAHSDEPDTSSTPVADPMIGKEPGQVRDDNGLKMKLVWCPPGAVTMGVTESIAETNAELATAKKVAASDGGSDDDDIVDAPNDKPGSKPNRQPTTAVAPTKAFLTKGYWIGKYEVTQSEWIHVMHTEPWKGQDFTDEGADFPATYVSWNRAVEFCHKLTERERQTGRLPDDWEYTLPTEAQWERACRARTETKFSFGDDESKLGEYAWFIGNARIARVRNAHRVGQKKANPWGLCDMHGNVSEWCRDIYTHILPGGRDPEVKSDEKTKGSLRVIRGGGWFDDATRCRSGDRNKSPPDNRHFNFGFRLALSAVRTVH